MWTIKMSDWQKGLSQSEGVSLCLKTNKKLNKEYIYITFMHLADSFIQSDLQRRIRYLLGFKEVIKSSYTVFKGKNNKTIL